MLRFARRHGRVSEPGLNFKVPLIENVTYFDKRVSISTCRCRPSCPPTGRTSRSTPSRATGSPIRCVLPGVNNVPLANPRLGSFVNSALRNVLAERLADAIVRTERAQLMNRIQET